MIEEIKSALIYTEHFQIVYTLLCLVEKVAFVFNDLPLSLYEYFQKVESGIIVGFKTWLTFLLSFSL